MGTTMHAHIEVKKGNEWLHFNAPDVERDYLLFLTMGCNRAKEYYPHVKDMMTEHKLPDDMAPVTRFCYDIDKQYYRIHSECFITSDDLRKLQQYWRDMGWNYDMEEIFHTYIGCNAIAAHNYFDDSRIILWYDH